MTEPEPDEGAKGKRNGRARRRGNGEGTISKRTDGRYTAAIFVTRPDGSRGRKWIYGRTRAEVAGKLTDLAQRVQSGAVIPTRSPTLSGFLDYWLAEVAGPKLRPTTVAKYRTAVELYLRPGLGSQRLDKLTVVTVQRYLNARRASGDSVQKLRMIREVLSSALGRAVREELINRNVAQLTTLPAQQRSRRTAWTAAQARAFLRAAEGDAAHPFFTLALVYGMRRGGDRRPPLGRHRPSQRASCRPGDTHSRRRAARPRAGEDPGRGSNAPAGATHPSRAADPTGSPGRAARRRRRELVRHRLRVHHPNRAPGRTTQQLPLVRSDRGRS